jgi:uncharacterized protein
MVTKKSIDDFLAPKKMAIAGVSRNPKKFGYQVYKELTEKGFQVFPINPNTDTIDGKLCYKSVSALPEDVKHLLVLTPKTQTESVVQEAKLKGITNLWIQQTSQTDKAVEIATEAGMNLIYKRCIFTFAEPVKGVHKFHRSIMKLFGKLPK